MENLHSLTTEYFGFPERPRCYTAEKFTNYVATFPRFRDPDLNQVNDFWDAPWASRLLPAAMKAKARAHIFDLWQVNSVLLENSPGSVADVERMPGGAPISPSKNFMMRDSL